MAEIPCHLTYELNRRQRLVPHIAIWLRYLPVLAIMAGGVVLAAIYASPWLSPLILVPLWLYKGFIVGVVDVLFCPVRQMDIIVEEQGLGFLMAGERRWLWLDGFMSIERYASDTWTLFHFNGHVVNIPVSAVPEDVIEFIKDAAARGHTPEGIQAAIERGRVIQQLEEEQRQQRKDRQGRSGSGRGC